MSASPDPLPYAEMTAPDYPLKAAATFSLEAHPDGTVLRGPCPRCESAIEIHLSEETVRSWFPRRGPRHAEQPADARVEPLICTCEDEHPGRPAGRTGCGAYWNLTIVTGPESGAAQT